MASSSSSSSSTGGGLPYSWGWNGKQAIGNLTRISACNTPSPVQRCKARLLEEEEEEANEDHKEGMGGFVAVAVAAGSDHSLLVSENGALYSMGSGGRHQLGYTPLEEKKKKKEEEEEEEEFSGFYQATPRQVKIFSSSSSSYPSHPIDGNSNDYESQEKGIHEGKRVPRMAQVCAGNGFSLVREITSQEALSLTSPFEHIEDRLTRLKKLHPDCSLISRASSLLRHEKYLISEAAQGRVFSFGTGERGELGLGKHILSCSIPSPIPRFETLTITKISCGAHHCLAIDLQGRIYSWGSNAHGKLGQQDYGEDRFEPARIAFLSGHIAIACAAGDNHSAVIVTPRDQSSSPSHYNPHQSYQQVCCFGKGAHGRLGTNSCKSSAIPLLVEQLPRPYTTNTHSTASSTSSFSSASSTITSVITTFLQVACGGAHTLLLLRTVTTTMTKTAARSVNRERCATSVLAWGYGVHGQLGNGKCLQSSVPIKALLPKTVMVTQVSAGHSWSLAACANGEIYSVKLK